jgi:hypothetical protein
MFVWPSYAPFLTLRTLPDQLGPRDSYYDPLDLYGVPLASGPQIVQSGLDNDCIPFIWYIFDP